MRKLHLSPFIFPIVFFGWVILIGAALLHLPVSHIGGDLSWIDSIFTATSAACVTGLIVVDTGSYFTVFGQTVILVLIQLGGLGIMTFTGIIFYLMHQRVSLVDRIAVGQSLLHDPSFHLGKFLLRIVILTFIIEIVGAILIHIQAPDGFSPFSSIFHSISAFCNAGFSLNADSLIAWKGHWGLNFVFMALIIAGGLGFSVLVEISHYLYRKLRYGKQIIQRLSWYTTTVLTVSFLLVIFGAVSIYLAELVQIDPIHSFNESVLTSLFQSVTCRTAGFNSVDIGRMTNVSLLIMIILMFIGGASGSTAGGIKVTTFRVLTAFAVTHIKGRRQVVVGRFAVDKETLNKALVLLVFSVTIISFSVLFLNITEGGDVSHPQARGLFLEIVFETISAFCTVGLSTGLTPNLTAAGKCMITLLMFIGRLGPILFISAIQSYQEEPLFEWPEEEMLIG